MNIIRMIEYLSTSHTFLRFYNGETISYRAKGITAFIRDCKVYGLKKTWLEMVDVIEDYYPPIEPLFVYWVYLLAVLRHKWYVFRFGKYFKVPLHLRIFHDLHKFQPFAFISYAKYFYGCNRKGVRKNFDIAWRDHLVTNKHHWQYWVVIEDDGLKMALDMPEKYVREMVCDWMAANFAYGGSHIYNWFSKQKFIFSGSTAAMVNELMTYAVTNIDTFIKITGKWDYGAK